MIIYDYAIKYRVQSMRQRLAGVLSLFARIYADNADYVADYARIAQGSVTGCCFSPPICIARAD